MESNLGDTTRWVLSGNWDERCKAFTDKLEELVAVCRSCPHPSSEPLEIEIILGNRSLDYLQRLEEFQAVRDFRHIEAAKYFVGDYKGWHMVFNLAVPKNYVLVRASRPGTASGTGMTIATSFVESIEK